MLFVDFLSHERLFHVSFRSPYQGNSMDEPRTTSGGSAVDTDDYDIIEMKSNSLQAKEVIDLSVIDEEESAKHTFIIVRLTNKILNTVVCFIMSLILMLVVVMVSVHFIFVWKFIFVPTETRLYPTPTLQRNRKVYIHFIRNLAHIHANWNYIPRHLCKRTFIVKYTCFSYETWFIFVPTETLFYAIFTKELLLFPCLSSESWINLS